MKVRIPYPADQGGEAGGRQRHGGARLPEAGVRSGDRPSQARVQAVRERREPAHAAGGQPEEFIERLAERRLTEALAQAGVVVVRGPKWCGKTTLCDRHCASSLLLANPATYASVAETLQARPDLVLEREQPLLVSEWQVAPQLRDLLAQRAGKTPLATEGSPDSSAVRASGSGRENALSGSARAAGRRAKHGSETPLANPSATAQMTALIALPHIGEQAPRAARRTPSAPSAFAGFPPPVDPYAVVSDNAPERAARFLATSSFLVPKLGSVPEAASVGLAPLTLEESGESTCAVSLSTLFAQCAEAGLKGAGQAHRQGANLPHPQGAGRVHPQGEIRSNSQSTSRAHPQGESQPNLKVEGRSPRTIDDYARFICRGGWPEAVTADPLRTNQRASSGAAHAAPHAHARRYFDQLCEREAARASASKLKPERVRALLCGITRHSGEQAAHPAIIAAAKKAGAGMTEPTLRTYLGALRRSFVLQRVGGCTPPMRSNVPLRSAKVWHLCDPSLAAAALGATPSSLAADEAAFTRLFATLCVRDLRVYVSLIGGVLRHYRDKNGLAVDAVLHLRDGRWAAVNFAPGSVGATCGTGAFAGAGAGAAFGMDAVDYAAARLLALARKVDTARMGEPSFLMVVTAGEYAYTRTDGVHVVPLACLSS